MDKFQEAATNINLHSEKHPHWSLSIDWREDRWDCMSSAPTRGYPILEVMGRDINGKVVGPMHYAFGDGDGLMPPFDGWFVKSDSEKYFEQVRPVEWQPVNVKKELK